MSLEDLSPREHPRIAVLRYCPAVKHRVQERRRVETDATLYEHFEWLNEHLLKMDASRRRKIIAVCTPGHETIQQLLREEAEVLQRSITGLKSEVKDR